MRVCRSVELGRAVSWTPPAFSPCRFFTVRVTGDFVRSAPHCSAPMPSPSCPAIARAPRHPLDNAADRLARQQRPAVPLPIAAKVALLLVFFGAHGRARTVLRQRRSGREPADGRAECGPAHSSRQPCTAHAGDTPSGWHSTPWQSFAARTGTGGGSRSRFNRMFAAIVWCFQRRASGQPLRVGRILHGRGSRTHRRAPSWLRGSQALQDVGRGFHDFRFHLAIYFCY